MRFPPEKVHKAFRVIRQAALHQMFYDDPAVQAACYILQDWEYGIKRNPTHKEKISQKRKELSKAMDRTEPLTGEFMVAKRWDFNQLFYRFHYNTFTLCKKGSMMIARTKD